MHLRLKNVFWHKKAYKCDWEHTGFVSRVLWQSIHTQKKKKSPRLLGSITVDSAKNIYSPCIVISVSFSNSYRRNASLSSNWVAILQGSPSSSTHFIVNCSGPVLPKLQIKRTSSRNVSTDISWAMYVIWASLWGKKFFFVFFFFT